MRNSIIQIGSTLLAIVSVPISMIVLIGAVIIFPIYALVFYLIDNFWFNR